MNKNDEDCTKTLIACNNYITITYKKTIVVKRL